MNRFDDNCKRSFHVQVKQVGKVARPKSKGETKSHQQHLLMTPSEVKAIDDWRFAHRIGSRGEAIRRLTRSALWIEDALNELKDIVANLRGMATDQADRAGSAATSILRCLAKGESVDADSIAEQSEERLIGLGKLIDQIHLAQTKLIYLATRVETTGSAESLQVADEALGDLDVHYATAMDDIQKEDQQAPVARPALFRVLRTFSQDDWAMFDTMDPADQVTYLDGRIKEMVNAGLSPASPPT